MKKADLHAGQYVAVEYKFGSHCYPQLMTKKIVRACVVFVGKWELKDEQDHLGQLSCPVNVCVQSYQTEPDNEHHMICHGEDLKDIAIGVEHTRPDYNKMGVKHEEETFWVPTVVPACTIISTWKSYEAWLEEENIRKEKEHIKDKEEEHKRKVYMRELKQTRGTVKLLLNRLGIDDFSFGVEEYDSYDECETTDETKVVLDLIDLKNILERLV